MKRLWTYLILHGFARIVAAFWASHHGQCTFQCLPTAVAPRFGLAATPADDAIHSAETESSETSNEDHWERIGQPIATISSPWLTVIAERYRRGDNLLDYWRLERASSVIVMVLFRHHFILPAPQFRPGVQECTLDFVGGRRRPQESVVETAQRLLVQELPVLVSMELAQSSRIQWKVLHSDAGANEEVADGVGLAVDSSVSNQRLYSVVAIIEDDALDDAIADELLKSKSNEPSGKDGMVVYRMDQVDELLHDLRCLQCRAILLEWLHRQLG